MRACVCAIFVYQNLLSLYSGRLNVIISQKLFVFIAQVLSLKSCLALFCLNL